MVFIYSINHILFTIAKVIKNSLLLRITVYSDITMRIRHIFNSTASETSILLIICCMIATALPLKLHGQWTVSAVTATIAGAVVLAAWLGWVIYVTAAKKPVREMSAKPRLAMETCSRILSLFWIYIVTSSWIPVLPFAILFIWQEYSDIRNLKTD